MVAYSRTALRTHRLRPLNLPQPIDVDLDDHGVPTVIIQNGRRREVESVGETWQIDDEWWRDRVSRRYVETLLEGGGRVEVYEDLVGGGWFMQS